MRMIRKGDSKIITHTGKWLDLLNPKPGDVTIRSVAHGLANVCRYAGQCKEFYSVAQHSVLGKRELEVNPRLAKLFMLHDAQEAFIGDVITQLKELLWVKDGRDLIPFRAFERHLSLVIHKAFKVEPPTPDEAKVLKAVDRRLYVTERRDLFSGKRVRDYVKGIAPYATKIYAWDPDTAEAEFMCEW